MMEPDPSPGAGSLTLDADFSSAVEPVPVQCLKLDLGLDDAFSAGDDEEPGPFELSAGSFRLELARRATEELEEGEWGKIELPPPEIELPASASALTWATVSTLELDSSVEKGSLEPANSYSQSPDEPVESINIPSSRPPFEAVDSIPQQSFPTSSDSIRSSIESPTFQRSNTEASIRSSTESPTFRTSNTEASIRSSTESPTFRTSNTAALKKSSWPPSPGPSPTTSSFAASHRPTRTTGPSILEQVISKTRPPHLPPKPRDEDQKHLKEWEIIMEKSRSAEERRKALLIERRLARERAVEESTGIWERDIAPDWRVVFKNPRLRKIWWKGIPTKLRGAMWEQAIGNDLALSKDYYKICLARANRALSSQSFPLDSLQLIEEDISTTLPTLHLFHSATGPMYDDLKDLMCAWTVSRSDEGLRYGKGVARIGAMLLINLPVARAFICLRNLLERHCLRSFFSGGQDDIDAYYRIFDTLLADGMPKVYFNFKQHQISPSEYLPDWLLSLFLDHLPFECCARIWDVLVLEGDSFLFRSALAILGVIESRLFFPDRVELMGVLRGEDKAAREVARRNSYHHHGDVETVDLGARYEVYGMNEETLWERIESMEEYWKESTWSRLIQRELPDI